MSFILDALKKSEESRTDETVAGIGKQLLTPQRKARRKSAFWPLLVLMALVFMGLGWWLGQPAEQSPEVQASEPQSRLNNPLAVPPAASRIPVAQSVRKKPNSAAANSARSEIVIPQRQTEAQPPAHNVPAAPRAPIPKRLLSQEAPAPVAAPPENRVTSGNQTQAEPPSANRSIPLLENLPASLRGQIPSLNMSLHFYSPDASRRMIRVNGLILREGEALADHLQVQEIKEKSVIFRFRDILFRLKAPGD